MHLLTGLLLGEMVLGAGALKGLRGGRPPYELVHATPGRVRFRVTAVQGDAGFAKAVMTALGHIPGVNQVAADARSGSVTVRFDDAPDVRQAIVTCLAEATADKGPAARPAARPAAESADGEPILRRQLKALGRAIDSRVLEETHGLTDLETLAGFLAGLWGVKTLVVPGLTGRWPGISLLYWSYNLLRR